MLELVAMVTDVEAMTALAERHGGSAYINHVDERTEGRPLTALARVATDDIESVRAVGTEGLHVAFPRVIKPLPEQPSNARAIAFFGLVRHPDLTHRQSDDHWRDRHAPLALQHHSAMCDYTQLSIVETLSGPPLDGVAMCAFNSRAEVREQFFNDDAARAAIEADVSTFADPRNSPRRVIATQVV